MHLVVLPHTNINSTVGPFVSPMAVNFVVYPRAAIYTSIRPNINTFTVLLTFFILTLIGRRVLPSFSALSILQVINPHTFVFASIDVVVSSEPICFVKSPVSVEDVSVYVVEHSSAVSLVV